MTLNLLFESSSSVVIGAASTYQQGKAHCQCARAARVVAGGRHWHWPPAGRRGSSSFLQIALAGSMRRFWPHCDRATVVVRPTSCAGVGQARPRRWLGRNQGPGHSRQGATRQPGLPPCLIRPRPNMRHDAAAAARPLAGLLGTPSPGPWELNSSSS